MKQISGTLFLLYLSLFCLLPCGMTVIAQQTTTQEKIPIIQKTDSIKPETVSPKESLTVEEWNKDNEEKTTEVEDGHFGVLFFRMILMLGITLLVALLIVWIAKRLMQGRQLSGGRSNRLQIIERRQLSPKAAMYLITIDDHEVLLGESATGLHVIKTQNIERKMQGEER